MNGTSWPSLDGLLLDGAHEGLTVRLLFLQLVAVREQHRPHLGVDRCPRVLTENPIVELGRLRNVVVTVALESIEALGADFGENRAVFFRFRRCQLNVVVVGSWVPRDGK